MKKLTMEIRVAVQHVNSCKHRHWENVLSEKQNGVCHPQTGQLVCTMDRLKNVIWIKQVDL